MFFEVAHSRLRYPRFMRWLNDRSGVLRDSVKGQTNKKEKAFHFPLNHLETEDEDSETTG